MILISHRGNINGKILNLENNPSYILSAIDEGYDVEVDIWVKNNNLYLGHDEPQYHITDDFILSNYERLWIHCKNFDSLVFLKDKKYDNVNYFWHETDKVTITSKGYFWVYPGNQPIKNSISVMPELNNDDLSKCIGICSDFIKNYTIF